MDDHLVKELMATVNCAVCGRHYEVGNIHILYHQRELWFLSVFCQGCRTRGLVAALIRESQAPELVTDLTQDELARLLEGSPVSADDLLDLHNFLEGFDGDFAALFGKKDRQA